MTTVTTQQEQIVFVVEETTTGETFESPLDAFGVCTTCPFAWHGEECLAIPGQGCIPPEKPPFEVAAEPAWLEQEAAMQAEIEAAIIKVNEAPRLERIAAERPVSHGDPAVLREIARRLHAGETVAVEYDGIEPGDRYDPEGDPPWEYRLKRNGHGVYLLELTRWTNWVNVPGTLYEPPERGWTDPETEEWESSVLAHLFDILRFEGLSHPE